MGTIRWRDSYSTGVKQFDDEHLKIVQLINAMFEAVRDKATESQINEILEELIAYTGYHFENEEKAMAEANFEELEQHRLEHEKLKSETLKFEKLLEDDLNNGTKKLYRFLREWLTEHILESDMKYSGKI